VSADPPPSQPIPNVPDRYPDVKLTKFVADPVKIEEKCDPFKLIMAVGLDT